MDGVRCGADGDLGRFSDGPVVGAQKDAEGSGGVSAVSGSQNVIGRDEGTSAEAVSVDGDGHLPLLLNCKLQFYCSFAVTRQSKYQYIPWEFVRSCLSATDDAVALCYLNQSTDSAGVEGCGDLTRGVVAGALGLLGTREQLRPGEELCPGDDSALVDQWP